MSARPNVAHYNYGVLQPWDVIAAWRLDYWLGNVVKYIARHQRKGDALGDLRKARDYLNYAIQRMEQQDATEER